MRVRHQRNVRVHERHRRGFLGLLNRVVVDLAGEVQQLVTLDAGNHGFNSSLGCKLISHAMKPSRLFTRRHSRAFWIASDAGRVPYYRR